MTNRATTGRCPLPWTGPRRPLRALPWSAAAVGLAVLLLTVALGAQPNAGPSASARPEPSQTAAASAQPHESQSSASTPQLPPGHPDISGRMGQAGMPGMLFRPRPNTVAPDPSLPAGSVLVVVLDAEENPLENAPVTLSYLRRSVAKGEASGRKQAVTDESGQHRFEHLAVGREVSYRLLAQRGAGQYGAQPFSLDDKQGVRVVLHAYEARASLDELRLNVAAVIVVELHEGSLSVDHILQVLNVGRSAWVPQGVSLDLPPEHQAFQGSESMTGVAAQARDGGQVELVGTFPPGQTDVRYSYRLPLSGEQSQTLSAALPPRTSQIRVVAAAIPGLALRVDGFEPAQAGRSPDGKRILMADKQVRMGSPGLTSLRITLDGLPAPSRARWIALLIALALSAMGIVTVTAARQRSTRQRAERDDLREARQVLLDEIAALEQARLAGVLDKQDYRSFRATLVDALERIVQRLDATKGRSSKSRLDEAARRT